MRKPTGQLTVMRGVFLVTALAAAMLASAAAAKLVEEIVQLSPCKTGGHASFTGNPDAWKPAVEKLLSPLGLDG